MTGFGAGRISGPSGTLSVEIRSLNSKFTEIFLKTPFSDASLENDIRTEISRDLQRGKISVIIQYDTEGIKQNTLNEDLLSAYFHQLTALRKTLKVKAHVKLTDLLNLPGVISGGEIQADETLREPLFAAIRMALESLRDNRKAEGHVLEQDMLQRCDLIAEYLKSVTPFEQARTLQIRTRMMQHMQEFIARENINMDRFEQELIYYLEKLDITEEKIRLQMHLDYFKKTIEQEETPGKKLAFITQEIGREINTLGSKANDASIQKLVVNMKDELEKIKEQTANIL